jgi:hypothetical protein
MPRYPYNSSLMQLLSLDFRLAAFAGEKGIVETIRLDTFT